jgi:glycosyltransferase involved in cell wall biosynthesis
VRVAIDARPAVFPHRTGIGEYTRELIRHLPRVDPETSYAAWYLNARGLLGGPRRFLGDLPAPNLAERWTPIPAAWFERLSERLDLPRVEWFVGFDVLFAPNFVPPPTRSSALVITVHDLAFRRFPETAPHGTRWWLRRIDRALAQSARIIVVSEATRRDLLELYPVDPDRVETIPHGVDRDVFRPSSADDVGAVRERFAIDGPYLLSLGGIEPRKNLPNLIRAFASLPAGLRPTLVVAGAGVAWNPEGRILLDAALAELPAEVRQRIHLVGYVSGPVKTALLGGAAALVYPSLYEGFGLPILEAMACGTPVLTSAVSSLPEVAGDAALLVEPLEVDSIRDGMERLLTDESLKATLTAAGTRRAADFSWTETARRTAMVLHKAVGEG